MTALSMPGCTMGLPTEASDMSSVYLRGRVWWCKYRDYNGHQRQESTGTRDKKSALWTANRREHMHWLVREGFISEDQLRTRERGKTLLTDKAIKPRIVPFVQHFIDDAKLRTANDFGSAVVVSRLEKWMREQAESRAARTVNRKLWQVQAFGDWLVREEYVSTNATRRAEILKESGEDRRMKHRAFTPHEAERFLDGVPERYRLFYRLRFWTGLRGSEARLIERRDLDLGDKPTLTVRAAVAKNGAEFTIPLAQGLAAALAPCAMRAPTAQIFDGLPESDNRRDKHLRKHLKALGFPAEVNGRSFRMSFVSWLLAAGVELGVAMRLRRDLGRGSERLTNHTYNDRRQTAHILRAGIDRLEEWHALALTNGGRMQQCV